MKAGARGALPFAVLIAVWWLVTRLGFVQPIFLPPPGDVIRVAAELASDGSLWIDIAASLGVEQLKKCNAFFESRRRIAAAYHEGFADLPEIKTPVCKPDVQHAWHLYVIQLELERLSINRRDFIEALRQKNIGTSVHFIPLHLHPYYRNTFGYRPGDFANASAVFERIISLPIYPKMTDADVNDVVEAVRSIVEEHRR